MTFVVFSCLVFSCRAWKRREVGGFASSPLYLIECLSAGVLVQHRRLLPPDPNTTLPLTPLPLLYALPLSPSLPPLHPHSIPPHEPHSPHHNLHVASKQPSTKQGREQTASNRIESSRIEPKFWELAPGGAMRARMGRLRGANTQIGEVGRCIGI
ncbi:hypothetical protein HDK77DRAFT_447 [Phyllosticta capitalensis]